MKCRLRGYGRLQIQADLAMEKVTRQAGNVSVRDPWNNEVVLAVRKENSRS